MQWNDNDMCVQVQALLRVSKTNFVVMKLLVGGHKKDSVVSGEVGGGGWPTCHFVIALL